MRANTASIYEVRALHITRRRTVALRLVVAVVEHDERQTALDFDAPTSAQSGVHVIDCDALAGEVAL